MYIESGRLANLDKLWIKQLTKIISKHMEHKNSLEWINILTSNYFLGINKGRFQEVE